MLKFIICILCLSVFCVKLINTELVEDNTVGFPATPNQYPWYVVVEPILSNGNVLYSCGGSLISLHWVLSTANCGYDRVVYFVLKFGIVENGVPTLIQNSSKIISHPRYDWLTSANNIALIKSERPISYFKLISPISLPSRFENVNDYVGKNSYYIGIVNDVQNDNCPYLRWTYTNIITKKQCANVTTNLPSEICSFDTKINSLCNVVPGSVLAIYKNKAWIQIGTSSISGCSTVPSVFTNIPLFVNWIYSVIITS